MAVAALNNGFVYSARLLAIICPVVAVISAVLVPSTETEDSPQ